MSSRPVPASPQGSAPPATSHGQSPPPSSNHGDTHAEKPPGGPLLTKRMAGLSLAALGVVYGDIGTSPLYAFQEAFAHGMPATPANIYGVISMIIWCLAIVVFLKYGMFILRADNHGEGGTMSLMALLRHDMHTRPKTRGALIAVGLFAAALFYGDGAITPAISVLSALEGVGVAAPAFNHYIVPLACLTIFFLFFIQKQGTGAVGKFFGPCMIVWFATLALLGVANIQRHPEVLNCFNPMWAWTFFQSHGIAGFSVLGAVFLALTGAEALYADMGHFGRRPIMIAWVALVMPSLFLNYLGQGALLLGDPALANNPFYNMAPAWALWPLIGLSTAATVIASQAVISGVFSMSKQAIALGYLPRMEIKHTNSHEIGQIFIPSVNRVLMVAVLALILIFRSSSNLSAAYGLAVNGTMLVTSLLAAAVFHYSYGWSRFKALAFFLLFATFDLVFLASNSLKFMEGGWLPVALGVALFFLMTTWKRGREILNQRMGKFGIDLAGLIETLKLDMPHRPTGVAIFMHSADEGTPPALLHNLRHNQVLHQNAIVLTVHTSSKPFVSDDDKLRLRSLGSGVWRAHLTFGFREIPDVPRALRKCSARRGLPFENQTVSYFLNRESIAATRNGGMALWRETIFIAMSKNASTASSHFHMPANEVVELGACVEI